MKENDGDLYRMRVTSDGRVVMWKRGERVPPEARTDICGICWRDNGVVKPLVVNKVEFPGKLGKVERQYICPPHGVQRVIKRQKVKTGPHTLKEPEP